MKNFLFFVFVSFTSIQFSAAQDVVISKLRTETSREIKKEEKNVLLHEFTVLYIILIEKIISIDHVIML